MPSPLHQVTIAGREVEIVATTRDDGDIHPDNVDADVLARRQIAATGDRWVMLDEVHGIGVVDVDPAAIDPGVTGPVTFGVGDIGVASAPGTHLAVWTADCAAIILLVDDGTVVGAHGGWRGLAAGVIAVGVDPAVRGGGQVVSAVLGPVIGPCCYEFGRSDLDAVADGVHVDPSVIVGATRDGRLALDVPRAVRAALAHRNIDLDVAGPCTGCDDRWFSHRVRRDAGRQATVAVIGG